jgi:hypothetical protein
MQNLTKSQNTIILVALENFLDDCKKRQPEFKAQITELIDIYNNIT